MWLTMGYVAYNADQFQKITVQNTNLVGFMNGEHVILKHFSFRDDAEKEFTRILNSIEKGQKRFFL